MGENGDDSSVDALTDDTAKFSARLDQIKSLPDDIKFWLLQCAKRRR